MNDIETRARELCAQLHAPLGLVDDSVPLVTAFARAEQRRALEDLASWLGHRIIAYESVAMVKRTEAAKLRQFNRANECRALQDELTRRIADANP